MTANTFSEIETPFKNMAPTDMTKIGIPHSMAMLIRCVLCMTEPLGKSYKNLFPNSVQILIDSIEGS